MLDKLTATIKQLLTDSRSMSARLERLEKIKPAVVNGRDGKDGKDGVSPSIESVVEAVIKELPEPEKINTKAIVNDVLAQIPKPRDGRDAPVVNVSDVAAIVLAKIPTPKDGKDGNNGPDLETVVKRVKAQVKNGEPGSPGKDGKDGKDGVSVTDVQLKNNELFVWLDGVKRAVGKIKIPAASAPFNPGNIGGGGGNIGGATAEQFRRIRPVYATMAITQRDTNDPDPYVITVAAHPSGTTTLNPPSSPVVAGDGPFGGYYKIDAFLQEGSVKELSVVDSEIIIPNDGHYIVPVGWGGFRHDQNTATVAFVFGIERDGQIIFSQRPTAALNPNVGRIANLGGGGVADLKAGDKLSVWIASNVAGDITLGNANVSIHMLEDTTGDE